MLVKSRYSDSIKGFSLIELSIVFVIISIITGVALAIGSAQTESSKYDVTNANIEIINNALVAFLANNGRLPCPANFSDLPTSSTYGMEQITTSTTNGPQSCIASANNIFYFTFSNISTYMGAVPFKTLGIPNSVMYDGWSNKFTYTTQTDYVNNHLLNSVCTTAQNAQNTATSTQNMCFRAQASSPLEGGFMAVYQVNATENNVPTNAQGYTMSVNPVYVLLSAGPNGLGAFNSNNVRNALPDASASPNERANTNCSSDPCSTTALSSTAFSYYAFATSEAGTFDDILYYRNRNQMVFDCNLQYNQACTVNWGIDFR